MKILIIKMKKIVMVFAILFASNLINAMADQPKKSVRWADENGQKLAIEKRYEIERNTKSFANFRDVTDTILNAKFNGYSRKKLLDAYKIENHGTINRIYFESDKQGKEKACSFEVKCPGYITNNFYKCLVVSVNNGKLYQLRTEHVVTLPTTAILYSVALGVVGGLVLSFKS